jgi:hypothetical protein
MPEPTNTSRKITLEDLLRLKRHERPGPEYWARFDRELNERVWRALVDPVGPVPKSASWLGGFLQGRARWLSVGAVSLGAVVLSLSSIHPNVPMGAAQPGLLVQAASANNVSVAAATASDEQPLRVASLPSAPQPPPLVETAETKYAETALDSAINQGGNSKVPATVAFAAEEANGIRYASNTLTNATFSAPRLESAY